ncbi:mycofactocin-coupled SDR family oxidoreductase [Arthrobacter sp. NPDC058127]|uniref:mycofactocin-coupled SDR family oxidoreductase n=1 Tax=Arthrobacter sp. NPDC058127 TaxID=3346351 RepID=UPI0036E7A83E
MSTLAGKVACITGAARGQGRSHALALAREGAAIIAIDSCAQVSTAPYPLATQDDLAQTVAEIEAIGGRVIPAVVDVRDAEGLKAAVDAAVAELGRLDIVLANAAISTPSPTLTMDEQVWQDTIDINLTGAWKTCRATIPHIVEGGRGGSVILTSSAATTMTSENIAHYTASKYGLVGLMKVLAKELAPQKIRVNTIHPSGVQTPMILNEPMYRLFRPDLENPTREDFEESARSHNAMGLFALEPEQVSALILFLVSEAAQWVTGSTYAMDGGGSLS